MNKKKTPFNLFLISNYFYFYYFLLWFLLLSCSDPLYSFHAYCSVEVHPWPQSFRDAPHPRLQFLRVVCTLVWVATKISPSLQLPHASSCECFPTCLLLPCSCFFLTFEQRHQVLLRYGSFGEHLLTPVSVLDKPSLTRATHALLQCRTPLSPLIPKCSVIELCSVHQVCD